MRVAILLALLALLSTTAEAQQLFTLGSQGPALAAGDPLNTGPFFCGQGTESQAIVDYKVPYASQLRMVKWFTGAWGKTVADIGVRLIDLTTGQEIDYTNQDRYFDPSGKQSPDTWTAPAGTWIELNAGDTVELQAYCSSYNHLVPQWLDVMHIITNLYYFTFQTKAHAAATLYVTKPAPPLSPMTLLESTRP